MLRTALCIALLTLKLSCFAAENEAPFWLIEQDFIKFGKKEAFEKYKKGEQVKWSQFTKKGSFPIYAFEESDNSQYFFLVPLSDFEAFGSYWKKEKEFRLMMGKEPYSSTLNFTIDTLHQYLGNCSCIPQGKESLTAFAAIQYSIFSIAPGEEGYFETHLEKVAGQQRASVQPVCFRTWKLVCGSELPKYVVAVFASSVKEAGKLLEGIEFVSAELKPILRKQKQGTAQLRVDLCSVQ